MNIKKYKILFVQRVITSYRLELLKLFCKDYLEVGIITSKGDKTGTLKLAKYQKVTAEFNNLNIHVLPSLRVGYSGESRSTHFFLYPKALKIIKNYDIIVFEGTTNLINNFYLLPYAKILKKKTIWWDAGYSLPIRSFKRKIIDLIVTPFVKISDAQMAYSSLAKEYMTKHMGAKNAFLNLNTINTSYFESISEEINNNTISYRFDKNNIKLLYVGMVEKRKKVRELIDTVLILNSNFTQKKFSITIIGGGKQLNELKKNFDYHSEIDLLGPIYDKEKLKPYYFNSDLFVLPGDGGLAILQSLLFGLPVLSIKGADGTELDYIKNDYLLMDSINEMSEKILNFEGSYREELKNGLTRFSSEKWVAKLKEEINII